MDKEFFSVRGFGGFSFRDDYGHECSLQESSAVDPHIWLGSDEPTKIDEPTGHLIKNRMHLNQEQVRALLPYLQHFAEHGDLQVDEKAIEDHEVEITIRLSSQSSIWMIGEPQITKVKDEDES